MEARQTSAPDRARTLSIVVPVYFNGQSLPVLFEALSDLEIKLREKNVALELVFVDDGSADESLAELLKFKAGRPGTKVVKLTRNFGAVHASKTGLQFVTGDSFITLAADLQDPPPLVLEMVDKWLGGAKYVICQRSHRADPITSRIFANIFYRLVRLFVIEDFPARGYGFCLMDKALLPYLKNTSKNINPLLFAYWLGFKPEVISYERHGRRFGKSRWTIAKRIKFFLDSLLGFSVAPIRAISLLGFLISVCSFGYALIIIINTLRGLSTLQGFATIVTILSFLLGLIIVMLGIIGEYIWRIFDEINKRPESVIDEIY